MFRKMVRRVSTPLASGVGLLTLGLAAWAFSTPSSDWTIAGPFGGTARSIALDPQKPDVVLAGGMNSLLFRSTDAGQNWALLHFPKRNLSEVTSLLVDPADSNHYLAGVISAEEGGLFESHDAGETWQSVKEMNKFGVRALTVAASKPSMFVAGTLHGVWLSDDSGKTWQHISDDGNLEMRGITVVAVDTANPDIIYAGTTHLPWKTLDRGKTWESIHTGMIDDSDVFSIFVDPANPASILASACSGIYASDSRGDAWKKLMGIPNTSRRTHVIRQEPGNSNIIFAGTTTGLYKTLNRGTAWKSLTDYQVNSIAFDPSHPGRMYFALEYEGVGKTENSGESIQLMNRGYVDRAISAVTRSGDKLYSLETQEGETSGIFTSSDRGESWTRIQPVRGLAGVHLKALTGLPGSANTLLASSTHQMYKSLDAGTTWKPLPVRLIEPPPPPPPAPKTPVRTTARRSTARSRVTRPVKPVVKTHVVSPSEVSALYSIKSGAQDLVFAATDLGLLKSTDSGERWTNLPIPSSPAVTALFMSADGTGSIIARTSVGLFVSKDCGEHWETLPFPHPSSDVNEIAIAGGQSSNLLAATRLGLYSSTDGGANWFGNPAGIPASTVTSVAFTSQDGGAYAVEYGRLFRTQDSGKNWKEVPTQLPSLRIRRLWQPEQASGRLYGITADLGIIFRDPGEIR
jgi:photosystem II stability/assembly factor-like uncharacterized protein